MWANVSGNVDGDAVIVLCLNAMRRKICKAVTSVAAFCARCPNSSTKFMKFSIPLPKPYQLFGALELIGRSDSNYNRIQEPAISRRRDRDGRSLGYSRQCRQCSLQGLCNVLQLILQITDFWRRIKKSQWLLEQQISWQHAL